MIFIVVFALLLTFLDLFPEKYASKIGSFFPLSLILASPFFEKHHIYFYFTIAGLSLLTLIILLFKKKNFTNLIKILFFLSAVSIFLFQLFHWPFHAEIQIIFHLISLLWLLYEAISNFIKTKFNHRKISIILVLIRAFILIVTSLFIQLKIDFPEVYFLLGATFILLAILPEIIKGISDVYEEPE